jgi:hypothetical protein
MKQVEAIVTINVGEVAHNVADLPANVQELVELYNDWRQEEYVARVELVKVSAALEEMGRRIVAAIQANDKAVADAAAVSETPAEETPAAE